jgi:hypothetical protein
MLKKTPVKEEYEVLVPIFIRRWEDPIELEKSIVKGVTKRRWKEKWKK